MNPAQIERRRFGRRDVCKSAVILPPGGKSVPCVVVNMSDGGALLNRLDDVDVPDIFELVIPTDDVVTACRVAHRTGGKIGVEYISLPRRASRVLLDPNRDGRTAALKAWLGTR